MYQTNWNNTLSLLQLSLSYTFASNSNLTLPLTPFPLIIPHLRNFTLCLLLFYIFTTASISLKGKCAKYDTISFFTLSQSSDGLLLMLLAHSLPTPPTCDNLLINSTLRCMHYKFLQKGEIYQSSNQKAKYNPS